MKTKKDVLFAMFDMMGNPFVAQQMKARFITELLPALGPHMKGLDEPIPERKFRKMLVKIRKEAPAFRNWLLFTFQAPPEATVFWDAQDRKKGLN